LFNKELQIFHYNFFEQLRSDEENKEASEIILAALELKSSIEPAWIGEYNKNSK